MLAVKRVFPSFCRFSMFRSPAFVRPSIMMVYTRDIGLPVPALRRGRKISLTAEQMAEMGEEMEDEDLDLENNPDFDIDDEDDDDIDYETTIRPKSFPPGSQTAKAWDFIDDYRKHKEIPDIKLYHEIMTSYLHKGWVQRAFLLFDEMEELGPSPDATCYNLIMKCFIEIEDGVKVEALYLKMLEKGVEPNQNTMHLLCQAAWHASDELLLELVLGELKTQKITMNMAIYFTTVCVYTKVEKPKKAIQFINHLAKKQILPTIEITNQVLAYYMKNGELKAAKKVLELMDHFKLKANHATYETTMMGYLVTENYEEVERLFQEMEEELDYQSLPAYQIMMQRKLMLQDFDGAMVMFDELLQSGRDLDDEFYCQLISSFAELNAVEYVRNLFMKMLEDDVDCHPSLLDAVLRMYLRNDLFADLQGIIDMVDQSGLEYEPSTCKVMIEGCLDKEMYDQALFWMEELCEVDPDYRPSKEELHLVLEGLKKTGMEHLNAEAILQHLSLGGTKILSAAEMKEKENQQIRDYEKMTKMAASSYLRTKKAQKYPPGPKLWREQRKKRNRFPKPALSASRTSPPRAIRTFRIIPASRASPLPKE